MSYNSQDDNQATSSNSGGQGNPAWNPLREHIPEDVWGNVQPILSDWDRGVQQRFETLHNEYRPYEQYAKNGVDPETIDYGLGIMEKLNTEDGALEVYKALEDHLRTSGLLDAGQEVEDVAPVSTDNPYAAQFEDLQNKFDMLAQYALSQREQEQLALQQQEQDRLLEEELERAHAQYGDFDDREILMRLVASDGELTIDEAVNDYMAFVENIRQRPTPPRVLGSHGNFPAQEPVDPRKWSNEETTTNMADILRHFMNNQ